MAEGFVVPSQMAFEVYHNRVKQYEITPTYDPSTRTLIGTLSAEQIDALPLIAELRVRFDDKYPFKAQLKPTTEGSDDGVVGYNVSLSGDSYTVVEIMGMDLVTEQVAIATDKAAEASENAVLATQKASEATSGAATATIKATEAGQASEQAISAQQAAEAARDEAVSVLSGESDIVVNLSGGKSFGKYTNGQTVPIAGRSVWEIFSDALVEYIQGIFTAFGVTGQPATVEVGTTISGSKTFTWSINQNSSDVDTIDIFDVTGNANLLVGTPNDGTQSVTVTSRQLNSNGATQVYRGIAHDSNPGKSDFNSSNFTITARFLRFFGPAASSASNSAQVRSLPSSAFQTGAGSFTLATGSTQKKFIVALPPGVTITSVIDQTALNADITAQYVLLPSVNVLDAGSTNRAYNVYEMNLAVPYSSSHNHLITTT